MKRLAVILIAIALAFPSFSQSNAEKICGTYLVIEKSEVSKVKVTRKSNGDFEGKIIWMKNPYFEDGSPKTDIKNPDPRLPTRLCFCTTSSTMQATTSGVAKSTIPSKATCTRHTQSSNRQRN